MSEKKYTVISLDMLKQTIKELKELDDLNYAIEESYRQEREYNVRLQEEVTAMRKALEFYEDVENYKKRTQPIYGPLGYDVCDILEDGGAIALHALKGDAKDER